MTSHQDVRSRLQGLIPPSYRETGYRLVSGVLTFLTGFQVLGADNAALWSQLGVGTITALFALLYATSTARQILYLVLGPLGAVLMAYGIISDVKWAVIVASVGQVFGAATAASKVVELLPSIEPVGVGIAATNGPPVPAQVAVSVASPAEAKAVREARGRHRRVE